MKLFLKLVKNLDETMSTNEKIDAIASYFEKAPPEDAVWALFYLTGRRFKRQISSMKLKLQYLETYKLPPWLYEECYAAVGDTAETLSLLIRNDHQKTMDEPLHIWVNRIREAEPSDFIAWWNTYDADSLFIINKLATGSLRLGVSKILAIKGLAKAMNLSYETLSERLIGEWEVTPEYFNALKEKDFSSKLNPYPFYLASPLDRELDEGPWALEWKWDGIRAQLVMRGEKKALWSRGLDLISESFPDLLARIPYFDAVLDGEIVPMRDGKVLPFFELQKRLNRKKLTVKILEEIPAHFIAYDLLELNHEDIRQKSLAERRELLEKLPVEASPLLNYENKDQLLKQAEEEAREGLMIKRLTSPYLDGRKVGSWWKLKLEPKSFDAVLLYAQPGTGKRASLYTDYTFGVWKGDELVPVAKAYSGLTNEEIYELDKWIRKNTVDKFGPVRQVKAEKVFEIAFEGMQISSRHKAGIALRFPRILRERKDKSMKEADTLDNIKKLKRNWE